ncbi:MAG: 6-phosphogluconolactonase [Candidatus Saccharimonadales bacterium]
MDSLRIFENKQELATAVAEQTIALLEIAIKKYGVGVWVLSGGTTPMLAYEIIAHEYKNEIDWKKIFVIIGDERIGQLDGPDNNWHDIEEVLLRHIPVQTIRPSNNLNPADVAIEYESAIDRLPKNSSNLPRLDVVWLGVGQDGHTLSLFPGHDSLKPTRHLVIPVTDSPKPPSDRISLSLRALTGVKTALIIASGQDKKDAIVKARSGQQLPIALATHVITTHKGHVRWLLDKSSAPTD